ncbi:Uma2 family endonuclease [Actinacidiphila alni]|uniref:Uma2 family endonuclease n=1 Tax=Actinacidiphila alni TaxID=380248 RepID=UPI0034521559
MSTAAGSGREAGPSWSWPTPPPGGWTADDLDRIPGLPPHTELIDGGLFFVSPQTYFHMATLRLLERALEDQVPEDFEVVREMTVTLAKRDRPEPDLMVVPYSAGTGPRQTSYEPSDIVLAVEVVSAESEERDRDIKPRKYAAARIRHFWRVEENNGLPVVYVYELDPATNTYAVTGIHHDQLKVTIPFSLVIDLTTGGRPPRQPEPGESPAG